jgi:DNA-binding MarR family transcriptional regulator
MDDTPPRRPSQAEVETALAATGFALDRHSAHLIRRAHQRATALFQEAFEGLGVTPPQFAILATLLRHGALSQIALGRLTAIDTATLSTMLRRLSAMGHVYRRASKEDQRVNLVDLTDAGATFTLEGLRLSQEVSDRVLDPLDPAERAAFVAALDRIGQE